MVYSGKLPETSYAGVNFDKDKTEIVLLKGKKFTSFKLQKSVNLSAWFEKVCKDLDIKIIACALRGEGDLIMIGSKIWLKNDIVPLAVHNGLQKSTKDLAVYASDQFISDVAKIRLGQDNKVRVIGLATLNDYRKITPKRDFELLLKLADKINRKKIVYFSATPRGGGVALMRHSLIRLFKLLGIDASWHVMQENPEVFEITKKKFHNILHGIAPPNVKLTNKDERIYHSWIEENAKKLHSLFHQAKVVVIDDSQPCGLIPHIKRASPKTKIIYRSHIQLETSLFEDPKHSQSLTWNYIWEKIKNVDLFVSHPIGKFVPKEVDKEKVVFMPATTDPLDGLNKSLTENQKRYYFAYFNKLLKNYGQTPLDLKRPYIIQVARFDPSKGIQDVVESYKSLRKKLEGTEFASPQLVIVGHGSVDDPEGAPIFANTRHLLKIKKYETIENDIKVVRLPDLDQLLNVLLTGSKIALQLSHKEGFEVKVSEALMRGIPVVAYDAGGIPLQIKNGVSGHLVAVGDTEQVSRYLFQLLTDDKKYVEMSRLAKENVRPDIYTISNAINWLYLANELVNRGKVRGYMQAVYDMARSKSNVSDNH